MNWGYWYDVLIGGLLLWQVWRIRQAWMGWRAHKATERRFREIERRFQEIHADPARATEQALDEARRLIAEAVAETLEKEARRLTAEAIAETLEKEAP